MKRITLLLLILGFCNYLAGQNKSSGQQQLHLQQSQYLLPQNGGTISGNLENVQVLGDTLGAFNAGLLTGNPILFGVEFAFDHYWVSGFSTHFNFNKLYKINSAGTAVVDSFDIPNNGFGGLDFAADDDFLYVAVNNKLYSIDPLTGDLSTDFLYTAIPNISGLAYDPGTDHFWISDFTGYLFELDREGNIVNQYYPGLVQFGVTGLGWDDASEDGPFLWVWSQNFIGGNTLAAATQFSPTTGEYTEVMFPGTNLSPDLSDAAGGMTVSRSIRPDRLVMAAFQQGNFQSGDGKDWIVLYDLGVELADPDDPKAPENPNAYSDFTTPNSIALTWEDPQNYYNGDPLSDFQIMIERDGALIDSVSAGIESYQDNGVSDGQFYSYQLFTKAPNDSVSFPRGTSWIAGGSPIAKPPTDFYVTVPAAGQLMLHWRNPSVNLDNTPLDDLAEIRLYIDGQLSESFSRSSTDSGSVDSALINYAGGTATLYLTAADNESPVNESGNSNFAYPPLSLPFFDTFPEAAQLNPAFWQDSDADVVDFGVDPPSPPYVMNLDGLPNGGDIAMIYPIDLSGSADSSITLSYWYQPGGTGNPPEYYDTLKVELLNNNDEWRTVRSYPGSILQPFANAVVDIASEDPGAGATFFHPQFRFRFLSVGAFSGSIGLDSWLIDDVFLGIPNNDPTMTVTPQSLSDTLLVGASKTHIFTITNSNSLISTLQYQVTVDPATDWLTLSGDNGTLLPLEREEISVNLNAANLSAGAYNATILVNGNDNNNPLDTVTVNLTVNEAPVVGFTPGSLDFSLTHNEVDSALLTIVNDGAGPLFFTLEDFDLSTGSNTTAPLQTPNRTPFYDKGVEEPVFDRPLEGAGGPDPYGYRWVDSNEPGGPAYQFTDISGSGNILDLVPTGGLDPRDEGVGEINLPFPIRFYGETFTSLYVSTNGIIILGEVIPSLTFSNQALPDPNAPNNIIAPFWDDLDGTLGEIYFEQIGNRFIIQWDNWGTWPSGTEMLTFQVILNAGSETITFVYENMDAAPFDATVGVENADGSIGLQVAYNSSYATSGLLTRISRDADWLSQTPTSGVVPPNSSLDAWVYANASGLVGGDYNAEIIISSNAPVTPDTTLPVQMSVQGIPNISTSPGALDFGELFVGLSSTATLTVENDGTDSLRINGIVSTDTRFSSSENNLVLAPFSNSDITVTFTPDAVATFSGELQLNSNDPDTPQLTIPLSGIGTDPPVAGASPDSISFSLNTNTQDSATVTISNDGGSPLIFSLVQQDVSNVLMKTRLRAAGQRQTETNVTRYPASYYDDIPKGEKDSRIGNSPLEGAGGPDAFGYRWTDSNEPGGPVFNWEDISTTGVPVSLSDDGFIPLPLPFPFDFYGESFNLVHLSANGYLTFGADGSDFSNDPIPSPNEPNAIIAPFWEDLNPSHGGMIYFLEDAAAGRLVIQYSEIPLFGGINAYTFQVILMADGSIYFQYLEMAGETSSATVGIENSDGSDGLEIAFNTNYVEDSLAVRISQLPKWLSENPASGTIPAGGSLDVTLLADASGLFGGEYRSNLFLQSNDPANPNLLATRVTLNVTGVADISVDPAALDYGNVFVGTATTAELEISNDGTDDLLISEFIFDNAVFSSADSGSISIPPLEKYTATISFLPPDTGSYNGQLQLVSNDPDSDTLNVGLSGTAIPAPEIVVSPQVIQLELLHGDSIEVTLNIANTGGSPLDWNAAVVMNSGSENTIPAPGSLSENKPYAPLLAPESGRPQGLPLEAIGDTLFTIPLQDVIGNSTMTAVGLEYAFGSFWVSAADLNFSQQNMLYRISGDGQTLEGSWPQGTGSALGWFSLVSDGTYLYGADPETGILTEIDPASGTATGNTITMPITNGRSIAYNPETDRFYTSDYFLDIIEFDRAGNVYSSVPLPLATFDIAWDYWTPGGPYIWSWSQDLMYGTTSYCSASLIDPLTGTFVGAGFTGPTLGSTPENLDIAGGVTLSADLVPGQLTLIGMHIGSLNDVNSTDHIVVYDLDVPVAPPWVHLLPPAEGSVAPGSSDELVVKFHALMADTTMNAAVQIASNDPANPIITVPITFTMLDNINTGISDNGNLPETFSVAQNYPNPFNPETTIRYQLPFAEDVRLVIYNVLGQKVRSLINGRLEPGFYQAKWDGKSDLGQQVSSGIYIYRFEAGEFVRTRKMIMLK